VHVLTSSWEPRIELGGARIHSAHTLQAVMMMMGFHASPSAHDCATDTDRLQLKVESGLVRGFPGQSDPKCDAVAYRTRIGMVTPQAMGHSPAAALTKGAK